MQPAILVATIVGSLYQLLRAVTRVEVADEQLGTRKVLRLDGLGFRLRRAAAVGAAGFLLGAAIVVTPPGHRGVIYSQNGGIQTTERPEGVSFVIPILQSAIYMNVRTQLWEADLPLQTSDLQEAKVPIAVNYRPSPDMAADIYRDIGRGYPTIVITPAVLQIAKAEVGKVKAENFAISRDALADAIKARLAAELEPRGIIVEFVSVKDAEFQSAFINSVQNKVIAEQDAIAAQNRVLEAQHQAEQTVKLAEGEANAILLKADAQAQANEEIAASLTTDLLLWRQLERWNGILPATLVGSAPLDLLLQVK